MLHRLPTKDINKFYLLYHFLSRETFRSFASPGEIMDRDVGGRGTSIDQYRIAITRVACEIWRADERQNWLSTGSSPSRYSHQYWAPVVANHFPPTSPFTQGQNLGYSLLPQGVQFSPPPRAPLLSHQPLTRQRSGGTSGDYTLLPQTPKLERKRSKKGTREVSTTLFR